MGFRVVSHESVTARVMIDLIYFGKTYLQGEQT